MSTTLTDFLYGERLTKTLGQIAHTAAIENTPQAWANAYYRASGIAWLLRDLDDPQTDIGIGNFMFQLKQCSESETLRQEVRRAYGLNNHDG